MEIHAMNATTGKNGLRPSLLVFSISPVIITMKKEYPKQSRRMIALQTD